MSGKIFEYRVDPERPPPLTDAQQAELRRLAAIDDADIDYSDVPARADWSDAAGAVGSTARSSSRRRWIDADVLHWLKAKGRGYQTRLNAILREAMLRDGRRG